LRTNSSNRKPKKRAGNIFSRVLRQDVFFLIVCGTLRFGMALFSFFEVDHLVGTVNRDISFLSLGRPSTAAHKQRM
jgi:hypothetical protein